MLKRGKEVNESNETYGFDAIRGMQANREYFVVICPLKIIPKLFIFNEYDIPPKLRAQRKLSSARIPAIANYILSNPDDYLFSSLTASVDGKMRFVPAQHLGPEGKLGRLYVNMDARMLINDGQHRRKAIEEALMVKPELGHESISVVFFEDHGLKRSQQMFADLNKNASKPSKSLNILYDHRDPYSKFIVDMAGTLDIFRDRVEMEKTTIGKHSNCVFTLAGISDATKKFLGKTKVIMPNTKTKELIKDYWGTVSKYIPEWQLVMNDEITADELREGFVHAHTNGLHALGIVGNVIVKKYPDEWKRKIVKFRDIDWTRGNKIWQGNFIQGKHMVRTTTGVSLGAAEILKMCNIDASYQLKGGN